MLKLLATIVAGILFGLVVSNSLRADETETRRVDISVSIFPRIVAVDSSFREKLDKNNNVQLLFVYDEEKNFAQRIANRMGKKGSNIGGRPVATRVLGVAVGLPKKNPPTAIFLVERLSDSQLKKIIDYAEEMHRLVFSPYSGDVERGVMVSISVTNRVQPYFNLPALKRSKVVINPLLLKMSKRYE